MEGTTDRDTAIQRTTPPTHPLSSLVADRIVEQVAEIRRRDPEVRADVPEGIHQLRVALRRLRTALVVYRPYLDRSITDPIGLELKWLGAMLAAARDGEVQAERLAPLGDAISKSLQARYQMAYAEALSALDSERYAALLVRLDQLAASPPWLPPSQTPIAEALSQRLPREWKRVELRVEAARATTSESVQAELVRAEELHEVRKAVKRLRYAAEPLVSLEGLALSGETARRTVKDAKRLQVILGEHQDTVAARIVLGELLHAGLNQVDSAVITDAVVAEQNLAAIAEVEFFELWDQVAK